MIIFTIFFHAVSYNYRKETKDKNSEINKIILKMRAKNHIKQNK